MSRGSGLILLLAGIWLIISPFVLNYSALGVSATNLVIVGIVVGVLALIRIASDQTAWASWINLLLGIWLIISPFAQGNGSIGTVVGNEVILGIIVAIFALTSAYSTSSRMQMQT